MVKRFVLLAVATLLMAGVFPISVHAETISQMAWHMNALRIPEAQQISKGSGVVVAVVEEGVNANHRDLAGQVLPGAGVGEFAGEDGHIDHHPQAHGTCMAGIIAGKGGGPNNVLGIAPESKILPITVRVIQDEKTQDRVPEAIRLAVDRGAKVISMSFSLAGTLSGEHVQAYNEAVRYAIDHDVVLVAGSGNLDATPYDGVTYPAKVPGVIAVGNTDRDASIYVESAHGPEVVIAAPGIQIVCPTTNTSSYGMATAGTSPATAIVSGAAALIRSKYPNMNAANVVNRLIKTAKDQGTPGRDEFYGFGTVRPYNALIDDVAPVSEYPLPLPELPKAAATTKLKSKVDPATIVWGAGLGIAAIALLIYLIRRKIRKSRVQQPEYFPPVTNQPTFMPPQPNAVQPTIQPQSPTAHSDSNEQFPQHKI